MDRRLQEENEKKKEYLKSYQRAVKRERDILEEIKRLRADKMFPSAVNQICRITLQYWMNRSKY